MGGAGRVGIGTEENGVGVRVWALGGGEGGGGKSKVDWGVVYNT